MLLILAPTSAAPAALAIVVFYQRVVHAQPLPLGLTLAGITLGLLPLRLLDGRPAPLLFRAPALAAALLALACVAGLVPAAWPLSVATVAVGLLLLDEAVFLVATTLGLTVCAASELHGTARSMMGRFSARRGSAPTAGRSPDVA